MTTSDRKYAMLGFIMLGVLIGELYGAWMVTYG